MKKQLSVENYEGVYETATEEVLTVYPNPANEVLQIRNADGSLMEVYDLLGQKLITEFVHGNLFEVSVERLPSVQYYIRISRDDYSKTSIIVIKH